VVGHLGSVLCVFPAAKLATNAFAGCILDDNDVEMLVYSLI